MWRGRETPYDFDEGGPGERSLTSEAGRARGNEICANMGSRIRPGPPESGSATANRTGGMGSTKLQKSWQTNIQMSAHLPR